MLLADTDINCKLACHWKNHCFRFKMDLKIDAPRAIRVTKAQAGVALNSPPPTKTSFIFSNRKIPLGNKVCAWADLLHYCIMDPVACTYFLAFHSFNALFLAQ